jgi:hypothetical protein
MAPNDDVKIILEDINAKIRQEREYYTIIGKHSLHKTSNEQDTINRLCPREEYGDYINQVPMKTYAQGHLCIPRWTNNNPY